MATKFGVGLALMVFCTVASAQNSVKIETKDVSHQLSELNRFQQDCLTLIRAPHFFFKSAESYRAEQEGNYFVRVSGHLEKSVTVEFRRNSVTYIDSEGKTSLKNFHLKKEKIAVEEGNDFSFVFLIPVGKSIVVPLIFHQEIDQMYDLRMQIDKTGRIRRAYLDPVPDPEMRNKLCVRSRLGLSLGATAFSYDQRLESFGGHLGYLSGGIPSLSTSFNYSRDPVSEDTFSLRSAPGNISTSGTFHGDLPFRWTTFAYAFQERPRDWIRLLGGARFHPFYRYGAEAHLFPLVNVQSADHAVVQNMNMLNAAGGVGFTLFTEHDWMAEFYMNLQYPLYTSLNTRYAMMFDGSLMVGYGLSPHVYTGINWYGQFHQFHYQRSGLDAQGEIQFVTSSFEIALGWIF